MKLDPKKPIKVIDLFSGPGGLAEGFANCKKNSPYEIVMSVECEKDAHKTLTLRSFYRKLNKTQREKFYYPYVTSTSKPEKAHLFSEMTSKLKEEWQAAQDETMGAPHALGNPEKWKKIRNGVRLTPKDHRPTEQEVAIHERARLLRKKHNGPIVIIGGPPCQSYSVNGRNRIKSQKNYTPENDERFFLYQEYLKVLDIAKPEIFIMENVEGILSAKLATNERIFPRIKSELVRPGEPLAEQYDIYSFVSPPSRFSEDSSPCYDNDHDYVITASDFGVPQNRKRVILLGIKKKYGPVDLFLKPPSIKTPKTGELVGRLPPLRSGLSDAEDSTERWRQLYYENLNLIINLLKDKNEILRMADKWFTESRVKNDELVSRNKKAKEKDLYINFIENAFSKIVEKVAKNNPRNFMHDDDRSRGNDYFLKTKKNYLTFEKSFQEKYPELHSWLYKEMGGVLNHRTRRHKSSDLARYMFSSAWAAAHSNFSNPSPVSRYFPVAIAPAHKNWFSGSHADRFRTICKNIVPHTITSHLKKDGHAQIHFDPAQNRSLTVREAARIQTFPDDYYFEGPQGSQFQQVGNAVPSFLAKFLANHVIEIMKSKKLL